MFHIQDTFQKVGGNTALDYADTLQTPALRPALEALSPARLPSFVRQLLISRGAVQVLAKNFRGSVEAAWLRNGQPLGRTVSTEITGAQMTPLKRPPRSGSELQLTFTAGSGERYVVQIPNRALTSGVGSAGYRTLDEHAGAVGAKLPAQPVAARTLETLTYGNVPQALQSFYLGRGAFKVVPGSFRGKVTARWRQDGAAVGTAASSEILGLSVETLKQPSGAGNTLQLTFETHGGDSFVALLNRDSLTFGVGSGGYRTLWEFAGARGGKL